MPIEPVAANREPQMSNVDTISFILEHNGFDGVSSYAL